MNCEKIETILNNLKVNSTGRIRGKNKAMNYLLAEHLKSLDKELMDIRVFVAKLGTSPTTVATTLKMIDDYIYQKQYK